MKIVVAGVGEMGSHLAKMLSGNGHDITVIDAEPKALAEVASLADAGNLVVTDHVVDGVRVAQNDVGVEGNDVAFGVHV